MVTFHSEFIQGFSVLTAPLFDALHKDVEFTWTEELESTWTRVKQELCKAPVLAAYQPNKPATLTTDASSIGLGAVLTQQNRPVAFASRKLSSTQQKYSVLEKEAMAFHWAVTERFPLFLKGKEFVWQTDH